MEAHWMQTRFGAVQVRVYRLHEGWWPVPVGPHRLPLVPVLAGPLPKSVDEAVRRMSQAVDRLDDVAAALT
jgi:hypothetical protein